MKIDKKKREAAIRAARRLDKQRARVRALESRLAAADADCGTAFRGMIAALRNAGLKVATFMEDCRLDADEFSTGEHSRYGAYGGCYEIDAESALGDDGDDGDDEDDEDKGESPDPFPVHGEEE